MPGVTPLQAWQALAGSIQEEPQHRHLQQQQQQQQEQHGAGDILRQKEQGPQLVQQQPVQVEQQQQVVFKQPDTPGVTSNRVHVSSNGVDVPLTFTPHTPGLSRDFSEGNKVPTSASS
jgi:hypothetical protein